MGGVVKANDDGELTKSQIVGERTDGDYGNVGLTNGNNQKMSLEEYDAAFDTAPLPIITVEPTSGRVQQFDNKFPIPVVIDSAHYEIHEGDHFFIRDVFNIPQTSSIGFNLDVGSSGDKYAHMTIAVQNELETHYELIEGVTYSTTGTTCSAVNRERNRTNTPDIFNCYQSYSSYSVGTTIARTTLGSGRTFGGQARDSEEMILKRNTKYRFVIINNAAGATNNVNLTLDWYEHTDE